MQITVTANGQSQTATLTNNKSAQAFYQLVSQKDITIKMSDYGNFEKVGALGQKIARSDKDITTKPGDIILYQGDKVTIYYNQNSWNFTLLGHIDGATKQSMQAFLGKGDFSVTFSK